MKRLATALSPGNGPFGFLLYILIAGLVLGFTRMATAQEVPDIHSNMGMDEDGNYYVEYEGRRIYEAESDHRYSLEALKGAPKGGENGISFDFGNAVEEGTLYYGFIAHGDSNHPLPVYLYHAADIEEGKANIDILERLSGKYDMINWSQKGRGTLGYRVSNQKGELLYDGKVSFTGKGPFEVATTMVEGPFVNKVTSSSVTLSFTFNKADSAEITAGGKSYSGNGRQKHHEILIDGLEPNSQYAYRIHYGEFSREYSFTTAPEPGSRTGFTFSYTSDSRAGQGGGERNLFGTNYYIMKKIMALNMQEDVAFAQFSGDLINGYLTDVGATELQYANWKRAVEPFAHYFPVYTSMGNHENISRNFVDTVTDQNFMVDRFPYDSQSSEAIFAKNFVNPENGPASEDGAGYDPNPDKQDFPSYKENVYHYTYDNVAMVVLNSDYFYAPTTGQVPHISGVIHAYIMNRQLEWFEQTIMDLENNDDIDHIFVTLHTPFFPNGGHVGDDMWYNGNNDFRSYVAGQPMEKGIIERRDQLLDIIVNESDKTLAILTGDEHNYARTKITPETEIYPDDYKPEKMDRERSIWQINNGAAGAPYYSQQETPWTPYVDGFTTQNAVVFFIVDGEEVKMVVKNPDTLEEVDRMQLR